MNNMRHKDILPDKDLPFKHCKLGREKYATNLTSIVSTYADGFVLAINNEWGTGKTTFVKMWRQHLENEKFKTLYFNAWEHDFDSNPLAIILGELKTLVGTKDDTYKRLLKKGAIFSKKSLPALAKLILGSRIDTKEIVDLIKDSTEGVVEVLKDQIDEYAAKKEGLIDFRNELEKFIKEHNEGKPLVFIIDELDRCRPNYAVEVLEQIKHFFSVSGIVFVLSIDKEQLAHAVRGVYGSENIKADEYLRRFIDLEYRIPEPNVKELCDYLYTYFQFDEFLDLSNVPNVHQELLKEKSVFLKFSVFFLQDKKLTRQTEKLYAHARIALKTFKKNHYVFPSVFLLLIYIREYDFEFYKDIKITKFSIQELVDKLEQDYFSKVKDDNLQTVLSTISLLLMLYNNLVREIDYSSQLVIRNNETNTETLAFKIKIGGDRSEQILVDYFRSYGRNNIEGVSIKYLLDKIDLLEGLIN